MRQSEISELVHDQDLGRFPFLICAFYTDAYEREICSLADSLREQGFDYHLRRYENRGFWEANTRIKPEFLLDCVKRFPGRDIVYVDADAVVRGPLPLFDRFVGDLGVFKTPDVSKGAKRYSHAYLTGTLYLANRPQVEGFLADWIAAQEGMRLGVDQDSFELALAKYPKMQIVQLPEAYVKIFDRGDVAPLIEHFQASRRQPKLQRRLKHWRNWFLGVMMALLLYGIWRAVH